MTEKINTDLIVDGNVIAMSLQPSSGGGGGDVNTVTGITPITVNPITGNVIVSHATSGVTAGTYKSVTVNATGHITNGTNPTTLAGFGITDANITDGTITLGNNSITPLTTDSTIDASKLTGIASVDTTGNASTATTAQTATNATHADSATSATTAANYNTTSGTIKTAIDDLNTGLAGKASTTTVSALDTRVTTNTNNISTINSTLDTKADKTTVNTLSRKVDTNTSDIATLNTTVAGKANQSDLNTLSTKVTKNTNDISTINTSLGTKADSSTVSAIDTRVTQNTTDIGTLNTAVSGKADGLNINSNKLQLKSGDTLIGNVITLPGGGTGSSDYNDLKNKPTLNGVEIVGTQTSSDFGIANVTDITNGTIVAKEATNAVNASNYATGGTIETVLGTKQDKTDNSLTTTAKTVVGAINENKGNIDTLTTGLSGKGDSLAISGTDLSLKSGDTVLSTVAIPSSGDAVWGDITGTLSNQTDLQTALDSKADTTAIPTKTSQLTNDSGYVTAETAPVTSVDGETGAVSLSDVKYTTQTLTDTQKTTARGNIGAGTSDFSGDYNDLTSKPEIPTKTSQLTNDSGYVTSTTAPVTSVNAKIGAVVLTANDVNALPSDTTYVASVDGASGTVVLNDVKYTAQTLTEEQKTQARTNIGAGTSSFGGSYNDLSDKPTIPTKTSELTNDSNFVDQTALDLKQNITDSTLTTTSKTVVGAINEVSGVANEAYSSTNVPPYPVTSVNTKTGDVVLNATDVNALPNTTTYVSSVDGNSGIITTNGVKFVAQTLTDTQKTQARTNIGAGTSNFTGAYSDLSGKPTIPSKTSDLTNDSGYITATQAPVQSVNGQTGTVSVGVSDLSDTTIATPTNGQVLAYNGTDWVNEDPQSYSQQQVNWNETDTASVQYIQNKPTKVSSFTNDSGYVTATTAPVKSVNTKTGAVVLTQDDVGNGATYVRTTNDYTTADKTKLAGIASGAEVNVINTVKQNGTALTITDKAVNVTVPTTASDINAEPAFTKNTAFNKNFETATANIKMDGTVSVGTTSTVARADHIHPTDTTRASVTALNSEISDRQSADTTLQSNIDAKASQTSLNTTNSNVTANQLYAGSVNITTSSISSDSTYTSLPYRTSLITWSGLTSSYKPDASINPDNAYTDDFMVSSTTNGYYVYFASMPTATVVFDFISMQLSYSH